MVYLNKLVVAIKAGGRILRESGNVVSLPFGSEYSVLIKNLNPLRAKFKLSIDGTDVTSGAWIIVPPNSSVEMERFIVNGDWNQGRRYKFIERSAEIEAHRGIKVDDGLVRVEFQVERATVDVPRYREYDVPVPRPWYPPYPYPPHPRRWNDFSMSGKRSLGASSAKRASAASRSSWTGSGGSGSGDDNSSSATFTASASAGNAPTMDTSEVGITVPGGISHQQFVAGEWFETGASEVIVLQLRGIIAGQAVAAPITVDTKITCASCGRESKGGVEFCSRCGTALHV